MESCDWFVSAIVVAFSSNKTESKDVKMRGDGEAWKSLEDRGQRRSYKKLSIFSGMLLGVHTLLCLLQNI